MRWKLSSKAETPLCTSYRPELDITPELSPQDAAYNKRAAVQNDVEDFIAKDETKRWKLSSKA
jgi:hypothetical protein